MRTVRLDVEIDGMRLRVLCEDETVGAWLREQLAGSIVDEPAPIGFVLRAPSEHQSLWLVLDRSGFVLGRARDAAQAGKILLGQLASFVQPAVGSFRLRARTFVRPHEGITVSLFPLFVTTPPIERRLERIGCSAYDRQAIDLTDDLRGIDTEHRWSDVLDGDPVPGHIGRIAGLRVTRLLVPRSAPVDPSQAQLVAFIGGLIAGPSRDSTLTVAEQLASVDVRMVDHPADELPYELLD